MRLLGIAPAQDLKLTRRMRIWPDFWPAAHLAGLLRWWSHLVVLNVVNSDRNRFAIGEALLQISDQTGASETTTFAVPKVDNALTGSGSPAPDRGLAHSIPLAHGAFSLLRDAPFGSHVFLCAHQGSEPGH